MRPWLVVCLVLLFVPAAAFAQKARPKTRTGKLEVKVSVEGAEISIDGAAVAHSPMEGPITLSVGTHTLKVSKPGHAEFIDTVKIAINETTSVEVELVPFSAVVNVTSDPPGADVYLDGKLVGQTPARVEADAGTHTIRVSLEGFGDSEKELQVTAGESYEAGFKLIAIVVPETHKKKPKAKPIYKKWWFWAGAGVVAAGVTAIAIGAASDGDPLGGADKVVDVNF